MEKLLKIINDLIRSKFWGVLEVRFEDGKVVFVRKTEHIKLSGTEACFALTGAACFFLRRTSGEQVEQAVAFTFTPAERLVFRKMQKEDGNFNARDYEKDKR